MFTELKVCIEDLVRITVVMLCTTEYKSYRGPGAGYFIY